MVRIRAKRLRRWASGLGVLCITVVLGSAGTMASQDDLRVELPQRPNSTFKAVLVWRGFVWLGAQDGLYRYQESKDGPLLQLWSQDPGEVLCLLEADGQLLVGGAKGLFVLKSQKDAAAPLPVVQGNVQCLSRVDSEVWVGTSIGLFVWNPKEDKKENRVQFGQYAVESRIPVNGLLSTNKEVWIATRERGLYRCPKGERKATLAAKESINYGKLFRSASTVWYTTGNPGQDAVLRRLDMVKSEEIVRGGEEVMGGAVRDFEDSGGLLWIGGSNGLSVVRDRALYPQTFSLLRTGQVWDLHLCGGKLWIAAEKGLFKLEGLDGEPWRVEMKIHGSPMLNFSGSAVRVTLQVDHYDWRTTRDLVAFTAEDSTGAKLAISQVERDERVTNLFRMNVQPPGGGYYSFQIKPVGLNGIPAEVKQTLRLVVVPRMLWLVLVAAIVALAITVAASVRLQRWLAARLGISEWIFHSLEDAKHSVKIGMFPGNERIALGLDGEAQTVFLKGRPADVFGDWKPDSPDLDQVRDRLKGTTVTIEVVKALFHDVWIRMLGGKISRDRPPTIAGLLCVKGLLDERRERVTELTFAGLGCEEPTNHPGLESLRYRGELKWKSPRFRLRAGLNRLLKRSVGVDERPTGEVDLIRECFTLWGGRILPMTNRATNKAQPGDLLDALCGADIVHVVAHADSCGVFLDGGDVTAADLEPVLAKLRCRLLVLAACNLGAIGDGEESFIYPLVQRGVSVLAASELLDDECAMVFFPAFYAAFFPHRKAQGITIAEAIVAGVDACFPVGGSTYASAKWRVGIDSLVLYANPMLHLRHRIMIPFRLSSLRLVGRRRESSAISPTPRGT